MTEPNEQLSGGESAKLRRIMSRIYHENTGISSGVLRDLIQQECDFNVPRTSVARLLSVLRKGIDITKRGYSGRYKEVRSGRPSAPQIKDHDGRTNAQVNSEQVIEAIVWMNKRNRFLEGENQQQHDEIKKLQAQLNNSRSKIVEIQIASGRGD